MFSFFVKLNELLIDFTNNLAAVFDKHVNYEFEDKDVNATIQTVTKEPYVYHVLVLTGGTGCNEVYTFYSNNFVGKMPSDTNLYVFQEQ